MVAVGRVAARTLDGGSMAVVRNVGQSPAQMTRGDNGFISSGKFPELKGHCSSEPPIKSNSRSCRWGGGGRCNYKRVRVRRNAIRGSDNPKSKVVSRLVHLSAYWNWRCPSGRRLAEAKVNTLTSTKMF